MILLTYKLTTMKKEELTEVVNEIINLTFNRLEFVYQYHRESPNLREIIKFEEGKSRLVFPMYGEHHTPSFETRISEQELRFAFVETFYEYCKSKDLDLFYSVETPTRGRYSDFKSNPHEEHEDKKGRSAEFDLVIYNDKLERVCLVEFKANNADALDHKKDFVKLDSLTEGSDNVPRFFVEIIQSYTEGDGQTTIESLKEKIKQSANRSFIFRCYALEGKSQRSKKDKEKNGEDISDRFEK